MCFIGEEITEHWELRQGEVLLVTHKLLKDFVSMGEFDPCSAAKGSGGCSALLSEPQAQKHLAQLKPGCCSLLKRNTFLNSYPQKGN